MSTLSDLSVPDIPPVSPGSSVSTSLQDEFDELLKFAVVVPKYDLQTLQQTLADTREWFLHRDLSSRSLDVHRDPRGGAREEDECSEATDVTPMDVQSQRDGLPDFCHHIPIMRAQPEETAGGDSWQEYREFPSFRSNPHAVAGPGLETDRGVEMEQGEYEQVYTATVDPDVAKMEGMMDQWCLDLKRNFLAEFSQSKIKIVE